MRILIIEKNKAIAKLLAQRIKKEIQISHKLIHNIEDTINLLNINKKKYNLIILDINIPYKEFSKEQILDSILLYEIPIIIYSSNFDPIIRKKMQNSPIIDYIIRAGSQTTEKIIETIYRIENNKKNKIMIVDDSFMIREHLKNFLEIQQFSVVEASNGKEAIEKFELENDISLIITDYNMPEMDGFTLIKKIRETKTIDELPIIGISGMSSDDVTTKLLKLGANDFIHKPFIPEELIIRINLHLKLTNTLKKLHIYSNTDYLTGLYNRRYFFDMAEKFFNMAKRNKKNISVAMLDIDFFKRINDKYGHDKGDEVLKVVAQNLKNQFRDSDILARVGGEEFCACILDKEYSESIKIAERIRKSIENIKIKANKEYIPITISIGLISGLSNSLEDIIKLADELLYEAKESGRNRVKSKKL